MAHRPHKRRHHSTSNPGSAHRDQSFESQTIGLPAGTLIDIPGQAPSKIEVLKYGAASVHVTYKLPFIFDALIEPTPDTPEDEFVFWINIENPNAEVLSTLAEDFGVHPLVLEEVQNPKPRPKYEEYSKSLYVTIQRAQFEGRMLDLYGNHFILGRNYLITFFEVDDPVRTSIKSKIERDQGRLRRLGADFLLYSMLDECVDRFFPIIEELEIHFEELEATILKSPDKEAVEAILFLKRTISELRHAIWPLTEVISGLQRSLCLFIKSEVRLYMRDIVDHGLHLSDLVNNLRETSSSIMELYRSSVTASLNSVMKVLTVISTIFIPLTFIAGLYGMNFKHMPELELDWAYPVVLIFMATVGIGMFIYFKVKKWI